MAKKLTPPQVRALLTAARNPDSYEFILEVVARPKKKFALRLIGRNGEPVMPQENVTEKYSAEYLAARLLSAGLRAKYKDLTGTPMTGQGKPVEYPTM